VVSISTNMINYLRELEFDFYVKQLLTRLW